MSTDQPRTTGQEWGNLIRKGSASAAVNRIIAAVNEETHTRRAKRADVIVACAQILGQSIAPGGPEIASEMRAGIISLIDGFALRAAVEETPSDE